MASLVERILTYRAVNGLTQAQFAKRCGVSASTIQHLETNPSWALGKMARRKIEYVLMGGIVRTKKED